MSEKIEKYQSEAELTARIEELTALNQQLMENQAEIKKSLKEYRDTMANAGYGMWHIILKDGEKPRMHANAKMKELLGISNQQLTEEEVYNSWYDHIVPTAIPSVQASVGEMITGHFSENTYQWEHPTKGIIYVRCGGTCKKLEDGTDYLSGYHTDVTDIVAKEKKYTEELEQAKAKAEEEQANVAEAYGMIAGLSQEYHTIWVVDKQTLKMRLIRSSGVTTIKAAVQMGRELSDYDATVRAYVERFIEPQDQERVFVEMASPAVLQALEQGKMYAVNYLRRDESGHVGYHQIAFANADTEDGRKQFVLGFRDIDQMVREEQKQKEELQKAKEEAEAANAAKTSFLFNMSHDIRTPMNAIIGFRDLLEKNQENPQKRTEYLEKIEEASTVLLSIINNVLEMARIERATPEIEEVAWSAEQFNDTLYSVFREMMAQKKLNFTRQIEVEHSYVFCDPSKLREIFLNILSNAYKYTKSGGSVNMHLEEIPSNREGWALYQTTITDTGIGISEEYLPHLFEEFTRENNSTDNRIEGTGLGMPIVKRLVDILDGTIEVQSRKGVGTTFIVTLPHRIAERSDLSQKTAGKTDTERFIGRRILLAEDNDFNAEIAMENLEDVGFLVERAENGKIVCQMLENQPAGYYDLILMDVQMPEMNGYEATKTIRSMEDRQKADIKIVALTANAFEEDKREALKSGMNGHLGKPVRISELMRTLAEMMK